MLCLYTTLAQAAGMYRWVDEDGRVHYSYTVPAEASRLERTQLDEQALPVQKTAAAKTKEQLAEEKWLEALRQKYRKQKAKQRAADLRLLSAYSDVEQLDNSYASRLKMLSDNKQQVELLHDKMQSELDDLKQQLEKAQEADTIQRLEKFITKKQQGLNDYAHALSQSISEKQRVEAQYTRQRKRFLELTAEAEKEAAEERAKNN